jgi:predicted nuclease of predicted toxin-antitoxin system
LRVNCVTLGTRLERQPLHGSSREVSRDARVASARHRRAHNGDDGTESASDPELLDRALALRRVIFTQDRDFLIEAVRRQRAGEKFAGVVYGHQQRVTIRQCIEDLEIVATIMEPQEMENWIEHLPL